jgi:hypothetical protein
MNKKISILHPSIAFVCTSTNNKGITISTISIWFKSLVFHIKYLYDFPHVTSCQGHSSGDGLAETIVKTVKNMLSKSNQAGKDPYLAMLESRNAPLASGNLQHSCL